MKDWFTPQEMVGLPELPITPRWIREKATREGWKSQKRQTGKGLEYHISSLPQRAEIALARKLLADHSASVAQNSNIPTPPPLPLKNPPLTEEQRASIWAAQCRKNKSTQDRGFEKAEAVRLYYNMRAQATVDHENGRESLTKTQIICIVAKKYSVTVASVRNWEQKVRRVRKDDWGAVLCDKYKGRIVKAEITPEAWDLFKSDYLRLEAPAIASCYRRLKLVAEDRGWTAPGIRTIERKIKREISRSVIILAREGVEAVSSLYPHQERDHSVFHALEAVNSDGHKFDVFVKWPDGEVVRPMMVAWQDVLSGKILSWRIDKSENSDSIRLAFGDMVDEYGFPDDAYLDNGRGFASKMLTGGTKSRFRFKIREEDPLGIFPQVGVQVHWCTPYHGQSKPIERAWRDMCEDIAKHPAFSGAYTGNKPTAKPENYGSKAVPLDTFIAVLKQGIIEHNAREGRKGGVTNGRSFDQVFSESYATSIIRKATAEQRRLWLLAAEGVTVRKNGTVTLKTDRDNRYWSDKLTDSAGQKVVVRFDPERLHDLVHIYSLNGDYIDEANCIEAAGFNDTQAGREHNRERRRWVKARKEQLKSERRMDAMEVAKMLPTSPPTETGSAKIVRPVRLSVDLRTPVKPIEVTDEQRQAHAALVKEMAAEEAKITSLPQTSRQRFQQWIRLTRRAELGSALNFEEMEFLIDHKGSFEWKAELKMHRDFNLEVDGIPIDITDCVDDSKEEASQKRSQS